MERPICCCTGYSRCVLQDPGQPKGASKVVHYDHRKPCLLRETFDVSWLDTLGAEDPPAELEPQEVEKSPASGHPKRQRPP